MMDLTKICIFLMMLVGTRECDSYMVAVFGGSGFVGRRICKNLIEAGCDVISVSRSGRPPSYYFDESFNLVNWLSFDLDLENRETEELVLEATKFRLPKKIDAAISCVGNVKPDPNWDKSTFFGLAFNNERLFRENGVWNQNAAKIAKESGAERFVFLSVSYEVAKMVEGPIEGYMDGKRAAEHTAYELFSNDGTIVLGPSLIYGGKRFPNIGNAYKSIVESPVAKAYVSSMEALRNLSSAPIVDWVEKSIFSSPIHVDVVSRVACAAALGLVKREMVGDRKQGFFNEKGKPVTYDNVIYIDGTKQLELINRTIENDLSIWKSKNKPSVAPKLVDIQQSSGDEPPFEGGLVGFRPYLFPLPVVAFFSATFFAIASGQFFVEVP